MVPATHSCSINGNDDDDGGTGAEEEEEKYVPFWLTMSWGMTPF